MIRNCITLHLLLCFFYSANAQSIGPSTLNTMGKSTTNNGITIEQSMGGIVAGNTFISPTLTITPGVLQPQIIITPEGIQNAANTTQLLTVFPNPTEQIVFIQANFQKQQTLNCTLTDALGKVLIQRVFVLEKGNELQKIDLSQFAMGQYNLNIGWTQSNGESIHSFKIQKIK